MKTKRGPQKPAHDMTDGEVAETLFGKRAMRKVTRELKELQSPEESEEKNEETPVREEKVITHRASSI